MSLSASSKAPSSSATSTTSGAGALEQASGRANAGAPVRTAAQIEADLDQARTRLANTVASLEERLNPRTVMAKSVAEAKDRVTGFYLDDQGKLRPDRVAMTAGAVVAGIIGLRLTFKGLHWLTAPAQPTLPDSDVIYIPVSRETLAGGGSLVLTGSAPLAITAA